MRKKKDLVFTGRYPEGNVVFHTLFGELTSSFSICIEKTSAFVSFLSFF